MSAEDYVKQSDLIAIVEVDDVETATTSHGFLLETASARIVERIYSRWEPEKNEIRIFNLDCHAVLERSAWGTMIQKNTPWFLQKGKFLVMLKMSGAYRPYDRFSVQSVENGKVRFPTESFSVEKPSTQKLTVSDAVKRLLAAVEKLKGEPADADDHEGRGR